MCNPPFYTSESDVPPNFSSDTRKPSKRHAAYSVNTAHTCESVYEKGGEVGFIKKMIDESVAIGKRIKFVSCCIIVMSIINWYYLEQPNI